MEIMQNVGEMKIVTHHEKEEKEREKNEGRKQMKDDGEMKARTREAKDWKCAYGKEKGRKK